MATAYVSDNYNVPMPDFPGAGVVLRREFLWTVPVLIINDTCKLCKIPAAGSPLLLTNFYLDLTDLDTSTGLALSLGDEDTAGRFIAIQTAVGQAAGKFSGTASGTAATGMAGGLLASLPVQYSANKNLILKCTTAPTSGATGTIIGFMDYQYVGAASPIALSV